MRIKKFLAGIAAVCIIGGMSGCSLLGIGTNANRGEDDEIIDPGKVDAFDLRVGDCLVSTDLGETFDEVPGVPCTQPHDAEVIYIFDMPSGAYDEDAIKEAAWEKCEEGMIDYVGAGYEDLNLDWDYFSPTSKGWSNGDHEIDCLAVTLSGENDLTSSVKGKG